MESTSASKLAGFGAEDAGLDALAAADDFEGIGQRFRLLEDFLLHVVLVVAEFDGSGGELRDMDRALDRGTVEAGDPDAWCARKCPWAVNSAISPFSR